MHRTSTDLLPRGSIDVRMQVAQCEATAQFICIGNCSIGVFILHLCSYGSLQFFLVVGGERLFEVSTELFGLGGNDALRLIGDSRHLHLQLHLPVHLSCSLATKL